MDWTKLAIAGGMLFAAYKFSDNKLVQGAAVSVASVIVAKHIPFVKEVI